MDMSSFQARKQSYHSAFRPVVKDAESIAKLHGNLEEFGSDRHLSPGTSCSYQSDSGDSDEEQEVDVETNKQQDEEEEDFSSGQCTQIIVPPENGEQRAKERVHFPSIIAETNNIKTGSTENSPANLKDSRSPIHASSEESSYKDGHKNRGNTQTAFTTKENGTFSEESKEQSTFFISDTDTPGTEFWRETPGDQGQETTPPVSLKKDVENMEKEELQKVLLEQIDLRRRLEQEFHALKGTAAFPVFNNFQDQMKRELAYREEMVQQLQMIPYANLIRKEKLGTHLNKS